MLLRGAYWDKKQERQAKDPISSYMIVKRIYK